MKEENKESSSPKSVTKAKPKTNFKYLIGTLFVATIYVLIIYTEDTLLNLEKFIPRTIGVLVIPAILATIFTWLNKGDYVKNLFWTSLVFIIISALGQLS